MAKEGSVAPKERINVTFKPATGGAQEEIELPLKLLAVGDYTHRKDERKVEERLNRRQLTFTYCQNLVDHLAQRCTQSDSGARLIDHLLDLHVLPLVADRLLDAMAVGESLKRVHATLDDNASVTCEFT